MRFAKKAYEAIDVQRRIVFFSLRANAYTGIRGVVVIVVVVFVLFSMCLKLVVFCVYFYRRCCCCCFLVLLLETAVACFCCCASSVPILELSTMVFGAICPPFVFSSCGAVS